MKQLGKGCWWCYSLAMGDLGGSKEEETGYHFIKAPSDCTGVHGLGMKMPPGQRQKWKTSWLLFREETINLRISYHDRREDNSYFIPTCMGQLVTTQQLRHRSYIPAWQAWVKKRLLQHKQKRQKQVTQIQAKHLGLQMRWCQNMSRSRSCTWINGHHCAQKFNGKQTIQNCIPTEYRQRSPGYEQYKNTF